MQKLLVVAFLATIAVAQVTQGLDSELKRLNVHTALIVPSTAVDEMPIWSPDSKHLGANVMGKWYRINLSQVTLQEAKWHGAAIGAPGDKVPAEPMTDELAEEWANANKKLTDMRKVATPGGVTAALNQKGLSTAFTISKGKHKRKLWQSAMENCHSLSVSPNEVFVAFICETNGVLVTDVQRALKP